MGGASGVLPPAAKNLFCKKGSWISKKLLLHRLQMQSVQLL